MREEEKRKWKTKKLKSSRCPIYTGMSGFFFSYSLCCSKLMYMSVSVSGCNSKKLPAAYNLLVKRCFTFHKHIMVWKRDELISPPQHLPQISLFSLSIYFLIRLKVLQMHTRSQASSRGYYLFFSLHLILLIHIWNKSKIHLHLKLYQIFFL